MDYLENYAKERAAEGRIPPAAFVVSSRSYAYVAHHVGILTDPLLNAASCASWRPPASWPVTRFGAAPRVIPWGAAPGDQAVGVFAASRAVIFAVC